MEIFKEAQKNFDYMVRIRRHMHEYPEMTGQEFETLEFIKKELEAGKDRSDARRHGRSSHPGKYKEFML